MRLLAARPSGCRPLALFLDSHTSILVVSTSRSPAVIATKGRESDYDGVKAESLKALGDLNLMIQKAQLVIGSTSGGAGGFGGGAGR
jgi:hypothetical protein